MNFEEENTQTHRAENQESVSVGKSGEIRAEEPLGSERKREREGARECALSGERERKCTQEE